MVKLEEKRKNYYQIRRLVKGVQDDKEGSIDSCWKILLEGALFEGRCGNREEARL